MRDNMITTVVGRIELRLDSARALLGGGADEAKPQREARGDEDTLQFQCPLLPSESDGDDGEGDEE